MQLFSVVFFAMHLAVAIAAPAPPFAIASKGETKAGNGTEEAGGEEGNEVEQKGEFGKPVALLGGDVKQDTLFPPGVSHCFLHGSRSSLS